MMGLSRPCVRKQIFLLLPQYYFIIQELLVLSAGKTQYDLFAKILAKRQHNNLSNKHMCVHMSWQGNLGQRFQSITGIGGFNWTL
jgi:hypothetical protein